ncbi:MAG TPA: hypothetical protein VMW10_13005 [Alphaproteobacteria bacterium]|nr:hypothetical protein [Alphaproteobacteria bacterium]
MAKIEKKKLEKMKKELEKIGKDPAFIDMLLKGAVKPKRMF